MPPIDENEILEAARKAAREVVSQTANTTATKAAQQAAIDKDELRSLIVQSVGETLVQLGIEHRDPIEMQRDFQHLREWRIAVESVKKKSMLTLIGIVVTGAFGLLILGIQQVLGRN